jgi:quinol monooxygenase YgiN
MIVRISRGSFEASRYADIEKRLRDSGQSLIPAIQKLPGMIKYYVGIDRESSTMVNVSIWENLEAAQQMASLKEMLALAGEFQSVGVTFERPIVNYETLWTL